MKTKYNYTLIISQYYHSRHMFIVKHDERFLDSAKAFATDLITYKRNKDSEGEMEWGDLVYGNPDEIRARYNINDSGDIYFIQSQYANYCKDVAIEYRMDTLRESRGFQRKVVTEAINEHHNYRVVKEIVGKYFEIA